MKALDLLITLRDDYIHGELDSDVNEAIQELAEYVMENSEEIMRVSMYDFIETKSSRYGKRGTA